jgi:hypothetical protein
MICEIYDQLTPFEKAEFLGSLCHAAQSDESLFKMASELIDLGKRKGLFDKVVIMPGTDTSV